MVVSYPLFKVQIGNYKYNPFIISVFFFDRFCLISQVGQECLCHIFSISFPSQCALCFWNNWVNFIPCEVLCCLRHPSRQMASESLSHSPVSDCLQKGAKLLMAPVLYSRRQVEWEPASNLIEGVCLTLQRQPIISFLPHLRSLINVCVNLVSSQVAIL